MNPKSTTLVTTNYEVKIEWKGEVPETLYKSLLELLAAWQEKANNALPEPLVDNNQVVKDCLTCKHQNRDFSTSDCPKCFPDNRYFAFWEAQDEATPPAAG